MTIHNELRRNMRPVPVGPAHGARLLSNGEYRLLLSGSGTGCSAFGGQRLTRWSGDRVEDRDGCVVYLRDLSGGPAWTLGRSPGGAGAGSYEASWEPGCLQIVRLDAGLETTLEACVVPGAPLEIRRLTLRNLSGAPRRIEVTTCCEVVLADAVADAGHPAFSKLFVQTEFVPRAGALLARRRPRASGEQHPWLMHALHGPGALEWETDRARFLGRGRSMAAPAALGRVSPLSGTVGNVLDPVLSLRRTVDLAPGQAAGLVFLLGAGADRAAALALAASLERAGSVEGAFQQARAGELALLRRLQISETEAEWFQGLAGAILYRHPGLRAPQAVLARAHGDPAVLARHGLDPALPLVVLEAGPEARPGAVPTLLRAQRYWRAMGLSCQVLVLVEEPAGLPDASGDPALEGVRALRPSGLPAGDLDLIRATARLVAVGELPGVAGLSVVPAAAGRYGHLQGLRKPGDCKPSHGASGPTALPDEPLHFYNGHGGFTADGREYVIRLPHLEGVGPARPPLPWINVVANEHFGFLVSESGAGYTWSRNSRQRRLTPWSNDPLLDPHGEALYVRDEDSGECWSPLPGPAAGRGDYEMRHGFGYSECRHLAGGLEHQTCMFVPRHDPVKIVRLRLVNHGPATRRLSLFSFQRLVLGELPADSGGFVVTEIHAALGAMFARNRAAGEYSDRVAFAAAAGPGGGRAVRCCGDREAFLGPGGSPGAPAALEPGASLDDRAGAGLDPCFAQQLTLEVGPGGSAECSFLLGDGADAAEAGALIARYRQPGAVQAALNQVRGFWTGLTTGVRVKTPVPALDVMLNGWLPYQTLACRIWGRSAFYQSGGAFGFRDQLQDSASLLLAHPDFTRDQIVLHAGQQFVEGDVLHWWHPPLGRGLRTRFVDDLLWLPYVTAAYVGATGDVGVLEQRARFLSGPPLAPGEDEVYMLPADSGLDGDVYEHCCRALDRSLATGAHGLPLFGSGDWNDGMNRVGREGRGESVWMGFFLFAVLGDFLPLCGLRRDAARAERYRAHRERLRTALNAAGWDGEWYRRAYYDDGTPLGSRDSDECQIDALAQAWAVISGAAPPERAARAMDAVEERLISEREGLIRLLAPPFEDTPHDPGYIKGYVPGVRENGGQYTHAALWVVRALAELGRGDRAARLLEMLGPVGHSRTPEQAALYRGEPYVVAADVYGAPPHVGRCGWSWYTGSSGWMYRVALESVLGLSVEGGTQLRVRPCVPDEWPGFEISYRHPGTGTRYRIRVSNPRGRARLVVAGTVDGVPVRVDQGAACVPLAGDGLEHRVELELG